MDAEQVVVADDRVPHPALPPSSVEIFIPDRIPNLYCSHSQHPSCLYFGGENLIHVDDYLVNKRAGVFAVLPQSLNGNLCRLPQVDSLQDGPEDVRSALHFLKNVYKEVKSVPQDLQGSPPEGQVLVALGSLESQDDALEDLLLLTQRQLDSAFGYLLANEPKSHNGCLYKQQILSSDDSHQVGHQSRPLAPHHLDTCNGSDGISSRSFHKLITRSQSAQ